MFALLSSLSSVMLNKRNPPPTVSASLPSLFDDEIQIPLAAAATRNAFPLASRRACTCMLVCMCVKMYISIYICSRIYISFFRVTYIAMKR